MGESARFADDRAGTQWSFPDSCGQTAQTIAVEVSQMEGECTRLHCLTNTSEDEASPRHLQGMWDLDPCCKARKESQF
jgi:hypothetical protein